MKISVKPYFVALLGLIGVFGIMLLYYVSHKPFTPEMAVRFIQTLWRWAAAAWLVILSGGIGTRLFKAEELPPLSRLAFQGILGLGIFGTGVLLVGSTIGLSWYILWSVPIALTVIFWRSIVKWCSLWKGLSVIWSESDKTGKILAVLTITLLALTLSAALSPPTEFDALVYHLTMPSAYLRLNRIVHLPWIYYSGMPQLTEMIYTWAMGLGGSIAATTLCWLMGFLTLVGFYDLIRQKFDNRAAWVGITALLSGYTLATAMSWGYADWAGLSFGWGCLVALDAWRTSTNKRYLVLAGVFAGFTLSTKYTGGVIILTALAVLIWHAIKNRSKIIPILLWFGAAVVIVSLPWWIKNWLSTGNPFYPFFFHSANTVEDAAIRIYQNNPPWGNWQDILLLPLRATYLGIEGADGYSASIGPLLLGLGIFFWAGWSNRSKIQKYIIETAGIFSILGVFIWIAANQYSGFLIQTRMYFPLFSAFALMAAAGYYGLTAITVPGLRLNMIINALVILVLGFNLLDVGKHTIQKGTLGYLSAVQTDADYLKNNLGAYWTAMQAIKQLPDSAHILLLYEPRSFYCTPRCLPDDHLDLWKQAVQKYHSPQDILQAWQQEGYTHILYCKVGSDFMRTSGDPHYNQQEWQTLDAFLSSLMLQQDFSGFYQLYSIEKK